MRRTILSAAALLIAAVSLHAQTLTGTWQGTLAAGSLAPSAPAIRFAFTVDKRPDGSLHGGMMIQSGNVAQSGNNALPLSSISLSASDVTFEQGGSGISYHGKLSADGKTIAGTMTLNNQPHPLQLELATEETMWKGPVVLPPMAANADPSFEVATIKPATPDEQHANFDLRARQFTTTGTSAKELIKIAYNIRGRQVLGGPSGLEDVRYDITAEPDTPGLPSEAQNRAMVHKLLNERFHLISHTDKQPYPVLAVALDPKGPKLKPSDPDFNGKGTIVGKRDGDDVVLQFTGMSIPEFLAFVMNTFQDKQLVDETGLTGIYDITLRVAGAGPANLSSDDYGNAMVLAAQHAGFKVVSKKVPLTVVVIDHIDPPSAN